MKIRNVFLLLLLQLIPVLADCQTKSTDSLLKILPFAKDTNRVNILKQLAFNFRVNDPARAQKYVDEAIALSNKLGFQDGIYDSNMKKGLIFYNQALYDTALFYFRISQKIAEAEQDSGMLNAIYSNIGNVYGEIGQNKICLSFYLKADNYTDNDKNPMRNAFMKVNIGTVYSVLEQHDSSIVFYQTAAKILEGINPDDERLSIVYGNIGATYIAIGDTVSAEQAFLKAQRIAVLCQNQGLIAASLNFMSVINFHKGYRDSAIASCRQALAIDEKIGNIHGISEVCIHLGEMFSIMKELDSATYYLSKGARYAEAIRDYYTLDNYYLKLSEVFEAKGNLDSALVYQRKLQQVKDTLYNLNKSSLVTETQMQLENEKQGKKIELLNEQDAKKNILIYAALTVAILLLLLGILAFNRYLVKKKGNELLSRQNAEIQEQKEIIEEKNKDITSSIRYAQRIQNAILPSSEQMHSVFSESWCYFKPKDIVSGDFYWFEKEGDYRLFAVVDCTGHGVPGALLSIVGHNLLGKALHDLKITMPGEILNFLNEEIRKILRQNKEDSAVQDGMDIAICAYHEPGRMMYYAGAFNPLYLLRNGEFTEIKADKILVGSELREGKSFTTHSVSVMPHDVFFLFSDGFADQFGGQSGKKLKYKYFRELLAKVSTSPINEQSAALHLAFEEWRTGYEQVDDVCVAAVRI